MKRSVQAIDKRTDGRSDLEHGPLSVSSFRQRIGDSKNSFSSNATSVVEHFAGPESLKIFCEVDGPKPVDSKTSPSPLNVSIVSRESDAPQWLQKQILEKAVHSALLPAMITPETSWVGFSFDLSFVIELPSSNHSNDQMADGKNLEEEHCFLQLIVNCVNAGSVALMARGIPMGDFVVGCVCSLGSAQSSSDSPLSEMRIFVDPTFKEASDAIVIVGATIMPSLGQMTGIWWYTSPKPALRKIGFSSLSQNHGTILNCLLATATAVRPVLVKSMKQAVE